MVYATVIGRWNMHSHSLEKWTHDHVFLGHQHERNERRTWIVVGLTLSMMIAEIVGGTLFGSMALLADGWHMSTHAAAIGIAAFAYRYARRHARDPRFAFGTGKLGELAAFTSAVVLAMIALGIGYESLVRLAHPVPIAYGEAIAIAVLGLAINLICAWLLREDHSHHHNHHCHHDHHDDHDHHGNRHHRDNNLRAAYIHVMADAATSVLAIAGLFTARAFNWVWIDPVVGFVGACVIASWAYKLIRDAGTVLIDVVPDHGIERNIRQLMEVDGDRVSDLHLWQIGPGHHAAIVSVVTDRVQSVAVYKERVAALRTLSHITIEVAACEHHEEAQAA
jgi:cation diffusion facilitator family transporter